MKKLFAILVFFVFQMICSDIYGKEVPTTKSYYVIDGFCCGGEDSDPHAVFGIEACLLYTSPSPRDRTRSRMPSSA